MGVGDGGGLGVEAIGGLWANLQAAGGKGLGAKLLVARGKGA